MTDTPASLAAEIGAETERIWLDEPEEIRAMRLGVFTSDAGSYGQYFSNLVFVNGDMRALSTWITPAVVVRALDSDDFTLDQCKRLFSWINLVNVDFLAYCGFVTFGEYVHRIVAVLPQVTTKDELGALLGAWYAYANRLYLWVHHTFPWGLGTAYPKLTPEDLEFMATAQRSTAVADYFAAHGPDLVEYASSEE